MHVPTLLEIVLMIPGVVIGFTFHEFAHAIVATWFGDDTPRLMGRTTLNPAVHLDPLGTVLLLLGGFGWAKPVQVNVNRLRPRVLADICVSLAGVTINFLLAVFFLLIGIWLARNPMLGAYQNTTIDMLETTINVNVWMVGFNLLPIPPLDGFRVVRYLLPSHMDNVVNNLYRMGPFLLMLVFFTGLGDTLLGPVYGAINAALDAIVRIVY